MGLSLELIGEFGMLSVPTPVNTAEVDTALVQLAEKKAYYEEKGKSGITLKELLKQEKDKKKSEKDKKKEEEEATKAAAKAAQEAAEAAKRAAEEEALAKMKAAEEAELAK